MMQEFKTQSNIKLKKAGKDKAAKKKVQEEIAKLEEELKAKHVNELEEWNRLYGNNDNQEEVNNDEPELSEKKPERKGKSRAQMRRVCLFIYKLLL